MLSIDELSIDENCLLIVKVKIVKGVLAFDVSPVAMFVLLLKDKISIKSENPLLSFPKYYFAAIAFEKISSR